MKWYLYFLTILLMSCVGGKSEQELLDDFTKANVALKRGRYVMAIQAYDQIIKESPKFTAAINNRGIAYMELSQFQEALKNFDLVLSLEPGDYDAAFNRTRALWLQGLWRPALEELHLLSSTHDSAAVYFRMGQIYYQQNRLDSALRSFDQSLKIDTVNVEAWINRGNIHYYRGDYSRSQYDIQKALALGSSHPLAMNTQALLLTEDSDWLEALKWIKRALAIQPEEPYIINNLGYVYMGMDSLPQAEQYINQSLLLDPNNPWAYRNKAIWYLKSHRPEKTIELLEQAQTMTENNPPMDLFYYLGQAYEAIGDHEKACSTWLNGQQQGDRRSSAILEQFCISG